MTYVLKMCACGRGTVYARFMCHRCYLIDWRRTTSVAIKHGTNYGYTSRGCRCAACVEAHAVVMDVYRSARGSSHG